MKNKGLFSTLLIKNLRDEVELDDNGRGRQATLAQKWQSRDESSTEKLWDSFLKQAVSYLQFVPPPNSTAPNVYSLFEDFSYDHPVAVLYLLPPQAEMEDVTVGQFWPGKLVAELKNRNLHWGILTTGAVWRLYSLKTAKPYEDFVELDLASAVNDSNEKEYALFERFFHRDSFVKEEDAEAKTMNPGPLETEGGAETDDNRTEECPDAANGHKCRLDTDEERSEEILEELVKAPLLSQVDEVLQYICNGFIADTERNGAEYTEEERREIFESAVKLLYRALFLFYAEARRLLPSEPEKAEEYQKHSIRHLCKEARKFRWNLRKDTDAYDLWKHLKGLVNAVNDGDPEYGIIGYNGGLFDDQQEKYLEKHKLRNDFLARALYLLAYVEPWGDDSDKEYEIPYEDLEVRHLGELYENILEFDVALADADWIRRRTKKGVELLLASDAKYRPGDTRIKKGDVFFSETALERKQTGSYYTPEVLVRFLNQKVITRPLRERFEKDYRSRFDEFCRDAQSRKDTSIRRGSAQSAIALIERFVQDVVLRFKTCDPGMGSGHFLVNSANQISDLIIELLSEIPYVEGVKSKVTCAANHWRRLVTRHCVYGIDLNPLAVHLAKLSLWLNCFAQDHRLTFLDHHLRCGNSLMGIRELDQLERSPERAKGKKRKHDQKLLFPIDLREACQRALSEIRKIEKLDEDSTDKMKELMDDSRQENSQIVKLADLYTSYLIDHSIRDEDYPEVFIDLARGKKPTGTLGSEILKSIEDLKSRHNFFHWAVEFPEIFSGTQPGFNAVVGNPPWDILKPNSQEFFSTYDPDFRRYGKSEAGKAIERLIDRHETIRAKWEKYCEGYEEQGLYVRQPSAFRSVGNGDINTFKLFLEQFFALLKDDSFMGIITPSGFYTDQGCLPLRKMFFEKSRIDFLYCFENRLGIFSIHRSFKFILFCAAKGGKTDSFKCAFMEHNPNRLQAIDADALKMKLSLIKRFSPDSLSVMEFKSQQDVDITARIYGEWPLMGERVRNSWHIVFEREMQDPAADYFSSDSSGRRPLVEGKWIHQYDYAFAKPVSFFDERAYESLAGSKRYISDVRTKGGEGQLLNCSEYRIVSRRQAASTNERTLIATVVQPGDLCGDNLEVNRPFDADGSQLVEPAELLSALALLNSYVLDYIIRKKVTTNLNKFYFYQMPFPREPLKTGSVPYGEALCARVARLICTTPDFAALWERLFNPRWQRLTFWHPKSDLIEYGPEHERQVRKRLAEDLSGLTPNWTLKCGVHDRLADHRDTGDRAQLRAEIDAYVAHLYGISRGEFAHILDTFPVLKKKELQAFGEFRSKRKCLEEYDQLKRLLG